MIMKPKLKTQIFITLIVLLYNYMPCCLASNSKWDYNKGGLDWNEDCRKGDQAPLDISVPFEYKNLTMSFSYSNMMTEYTFSNDGNNLYLEGDFGYMTYNNITFFSSNIQFYSPSLHTFSNKHMPLEMVINHHDSLGNKISVSILFRYSLSDYSLLLGRLGFDKVELQKQEPFKPSTLKEEVDLSKYIKEGKDFFMYEGKEASPPCIRNTTYLILTDVLKVSKKQLDNFPLIVKNKNRIIQKRNDRKIFSTFKMEDILKKQEAIKKKVEALKKMKDEENKIKQSIEQKEIKKLAEEKEKSLILNSTNLNKTEVVLHNLNTTQINVTNSTNPHVTQEEIIKQINSIANKRNHNLNKTSNVSCVSKDYIPFDVVKEKAKAYEDYVKSSDPKLFGDNPVLSRNSTMVIDKDLPKSKSEIERADLNAKFELWKTMFEKSTNGTKVDHLLFIQMKTLEKELERKKFAPYLKHRRINEATSSFSFVQLINQDEIEDVKVFPVKSFAQTKIDSKYVDTSFMDKDIEQFFNQAGEVAPTSDALVKAKKELKKQEEARKEMKRKRGQVLKTVMEDKLRVKQMKIFQSNKIVDDKGMIINKDNSSQEEQINKVPHLKINFKGDNHVQVEAKINQEFPSHKLIGNIKAVKLEAKTQTIESTIKNNLHILAKANEIGIVNTHETKLVAKEKLASVNSIPLITNIVKKSEIVPPIQSLAIKKTDNFENKIDLKVKVMDEPPKPKIKIMKVVPVKVVKPVPIIPIIPVTPKNIKVSVNIPVETKPKPKFNLEIQSDEVTQLQRKLFEEKLEKYRQLKHNFEKAAVIQEQEKLSPSDKTDSSLNSNVKVKETEVTVNSNSQVSDIKQDLKNTEKQNQHFLDNSGNSDSQNSLKEAQSQFKDNIKKYEKLRSVAEVLSHSYEVKNSKLGNKIENSTLQINNTQINLNFKNTDDLSQNLPSKVKISPEEVFDTNINYNKKILTSLNLVFANIINQLKKLDLINKRLTSYDDNIVANHQNNFLSNSGLIRITTTNLALILRKAFSLDIKSDSENYNAKLNKLNEFTSKILMDQNKYLNDLFFDSNNVDISQINEIISNINLKDETNQYQLNNLDNEKLNELVMKVIEKLPISLMKEDKEKLKDESSENQDDEDMFITSKNKNRLRKVLGPKLLEKREAQLDPKPGQGRKAVTKDGIIEKNEIHNTASWPDKCKTGLQSPININKPYFPEERHLKINLQPPTGKMTLMNDGYKLIFSAESFGSVTHGVHTYQARQIEIHHPSEHTFGDDEVRSPLELQIICQDVFGNTVAVSVLFKLQEEKDNNKGSEFLSVLGFGDDNPLFALKLRNNEVIQINADKNKLDLGKLINNATHYVTYIGSLTSPPCTQNVQWFVLLQKLEVSESQLEYFPILFGRETNIRGLQSINNRQLKII